MHWFIAWCGPPVDFRIASKDHYSAMSISREFVVRAEEKGERIDKLLSHLFSGLSRSKWQALIQEGQVRIDGEAKKPSYQTKPGDRVEINIPESFDSQELIPQDLPLDVVYEDQSLIGVNKPTSMVVHPGPGHEDETLANALIFHYPDLPDLPDPSRPGIVHRLDKDTSGVLVVVRTETAFRSIKKQFKKREAKKVYIALVAGRFEEERGMIDAPIGRSSKDKTKMTVKLGGKESRTKFHVLEEYEDSSLLEIRPTTGRTHQIRVHMDYINHRIIGDTYYGGREFKRLMLHARSLSVRHPESGDNLALTAPLPVEFEELIPEEPESGL